MRCRPFFAVAAVAAVCAPASAQKNSAPLLPTFGDTRALAGKLAGEVPLRVIGARDLTRQVRLRAPLGTDGTACVLRIGDKTVATFDSLPWEGKLDTRRFRDGGYVLRLVVVDSKTDAETTLEQTDVFFANKDKQGKDDNIAAEQGTRTALVSRHGARERAMPPLSSLRQIPLDGAVLPSTARVNRLTPRLSVLKSVGAVRATVLAYAGGQLVMGLPDGGIALCTEEQAEQGGGSVVRLPEDAGATRAVAVQNGAVWWVTGRQDIVYRWRVGEDRLAAYDVSRDGKPDEPWVRSLAAWRGQVALQGSGNCRVLTVDGALADFCDELPPDVAASARAGSILLADYGDVGRRLAVAEPGGGGNLRVYGSERNSRDWTEQLTQPIARNMNRCTLALAAWGVAMLDSSPGGAAQAWMLPPGKGEAVSVPEMRIGWGGTLGGALHARQISIGGSGEWVGADGVLFHTDLRSGRVSAYLPWNGAGGTIRDLVADTKGVWVATDSGVCRVTPEHSDPKTGFGGYVRALLGDEGDLPQGGVDQTALATAEEWQGVPYLWGGTMKSGTDCSGYVGAIHRACGVELPRTSSDMGTTSKGKRVRDELHFGDTLVFPGHVAFYIGNGQTAETTNNAVGKASIWRRRTVIVRRFLH